MPFCNHPERIIMSDNREIATQILFQTFSKRSFLDFETLDKNPDSDRGFIKMLVMTTTRRYEFIRKVIRQFAPKRLPEKAAYANYALAAAVTELLFMDTPDYAVINSYVSLIKKHCDKYVAGFANAVLRKIAAEKDLLKGHDRGEFFTTAFFELLNKDYSKGMIRRLQEVSLLEPPLAITVKSDPAVWAEKLNGKLLDGNTIILPNSGKIRELPGYAAGEWWVQDYAASLAVSTIKDLQGKRVLDLCAAPGGKTAQLLSRGAKVTSLDNSQQRLKILRENMERLQLQPEQIVCADALDYLQNFDNEPYDIILLDAPCSGTGIFRRHPELVHIKNLQDTIRQAELQKQILSATDKALKTGGILVYCTCSIAKNEGELQIDAFLQTHANFQIQPLNHPRFPEMVTEQGYLRTLPHQLTEFGGCDAFFIAQLTKVG